MFFLSSYRSKETKERKGLFLIKGIIVLGDLGGVDLERRI